MIGEHDAYLAAHACCIIPDDHIQVHADDGTVVVRWLVPGVYAAGDVIPELIAPAWKHAHDC